MTINWKLRFKNVAWWVQVGGAFILTALGYHSLNPQDLTTWAGLWNIIVGVFSNPYLLFICLWNMFSASTDPTVSGLSDSERALTYEQPISQESGGIL